MNSARKLLNKLSGISFGVTLNSTKKLFNKLSGISLLVIIAWVISTFMLVGLPKALLSTLFLLLVPGFFLYRILVKRDDSLWKTAAYSVGLSLLYLMVLGLLLNQIYVHYSLASPLSQVPLTVTVGVTTAIMALIANFGRPTIRKIRPPKQSWIWWLTVAMGALLPLLAVAGAVTLNNGGGSFLALLALGLTAAAFVLIIWRTKTDEHLYPYALYVLALTLLLGTSMRGWNITGHDVMQEFQVFLLTSAHSVWRMSNYQDAYNACLSITILPTVLQRLTGIANQYIYKIIFQLFFALIAPILYLSLKDYTSKMMALASVFVYISFPTFLTDITMLNRQETALLFLGLAIMAALDRRLNKFAQGALTFLFIIGMILSHYSTSYIALAILLLALVLRLSVRLFHKMRHGRDIKKLGQIIPTWITLAAFLILFAWVNLATHTAGHIGQTILDVRANIPKLLSSSSNNQSSASRPTASSAALINQYVTSEQTARPLPQIDYYPTSTVSSPQYRIAAASEVVDAENATLVKLQVPKSLLYNIYNLLRQSYAKAIEVLIVLGLGLLLWQGKRWHNLPLQYQFMSVASLIVIGVQTLLPANVINYGLARLIQQNLFFLALPIVIAGCWLAKLVRLPETVRIKLVAIALAGFFLVLSGFAPAVTGGYKPALAISNSGFYYQAYYSHQDEISADQFLATHTPKGSRVYADEFARRQIITYAGIFAQPTLVPGAMPIDSYVYLSHGNTSTGMVPVYIGGNLGYYQVPFSFLRDNKNLVYSTGSVEIYK